MTSRSRDGGIEDEKREPHSDDELDYLLSRGSLGGAQRDRIFDAVAASVRRQPGPPARPARRKPWMIASGAALVAAVACLVVWTRAPVDGDTFRRKGNVGAAPVAVDVLCLHATLAACPRGSLLAFSVAGASSEAFLTAYLQPAGPAPRTWLLRNERVSAQVVGSGGLLARGARIPQDQNAGAYRIEVLVTRLPLPGAEPAARAEDVVARARFDATVPP